jgi:ribosomal protein RSM22 (predicted rRNA methylase)
VAPTPLKALRELRQNFLDSSAALASDYWSSRELLELYDRSLGFRNQWKWSALLSELVLRKIHFLGSSVLDWGCGTGAGARSFANVFDAPSITYSLYDRSQLAAGFALQSIVAQLGQQRSSSLRSFTTLDSAERFNLALVSHVHNELSPAVSADLRRTLFERCDSFAWVEGGTPEAAQSLVLIREQALEHGFEALAPCTHQLACPLAKPGQNDWCHRFAWAPALSHHDSEWARLCRELGIDSRRVAFSFLLMQRRDKQVWTLGEPRARARIIGEPRVYKGFSQALICADGRLTQHRVQKRNETNLYRQTQDFSKTLGKLPEVDVEDA